MAFTANPQPPCFKLMTHSVSQNAPEPDRSADKDAGRAEGNRVERDASTANAEINQPMSNPAMSPLQAQATIDDLQRELNRLQRSIRLAIQTHLQKLTGRSFGSLQQNQQLVQSVHALLEGHGLRIQCSECGHPAILRVSPRPGIEHGAFVFDHTIENRRTFHGGRPVMPEIRLVAKPQRKKAAAGKKAAG